MVPYCTYDATPLEDAYVRHVLPGPDDASEIPFDTHV